MKGRIEIDQERCKGCGLCIDVCPKKNIQISPQLNTKGYYPACSSEQAHDAEKECTGCALCAVICPDVAIEVYRESKGDQDQQDNLKEE